MEEEPIVPKPTSRTLAFAMSGAVAVGTFGLASTAHAGAMASGVVVDSCGMDDTITLSSIDPTKSYRVTFSNGVNLPVSRQYTAANVPSPIKRRIVAPVMTGPVTVTITEFLGQTQDDVLLTGGPQVSTDFNLTDLKCAVPNVSANDMPGTLNDTFKIPLTTGVTYYRNGQIISPGIYRAVGNVVITAQPSDPSKYVLVNSSYEPIEYTFDMTFGGLATLTIPSNRVPQLITDPDGDVVRIYNVPGVAWTLDGKSVKVTGADAYSEFPVNARGTATVIAAPAAPTTTSLAGQDEWTFGASRVVTIPKDKAPTASDQPGSRQDAVTVYAVTGVKWKVNGVDVAFAPGETSKLVSTGGKAAVTVAATSADPTKYRLTGTTSWPLTFKTGTQITISDVKAPLANDNSGAANDTVTVYAVDKVIWTVGRTEVTFDKGQTSKNVPINGATNVTVRATVAAGSGSSSAADTEIAGSDSWELMFNTAAQTTSARPTAAARTDEAGVTPRQSVVRWAAPAGLTGPATYEVAFRIVNVTADGKRVPGPWKPWLGGTKATRATFTGLPGGVYEISVRATGADGTVSAWSAPSRVLVPLDIRRPGGRAGAAWKLTIDKTAAASTMLTTATRRAAWATVTPATDRIMAWVGTGPTNGYVNVMVDGKLRARINTWSARPHTRQMLVNLAVDWGKHRLAFVNAPLGRRTVTKLDALAYNR